MEKKQIDKMVLKYLIWIVIGILVIRYFGNLSGVAVSIWNIAHPLVLGSIIAYILNVLMRKVEHLLFSNIENKWLKKGKRGISILLSIFIIVMILVLVLGLVVPELVNAFILIGKAVPVYIERGIDWLAIHFDQFPGIEEELAQLQINWESVMKNIVEYAKSGVAGLLNSTVSIVSVLAGGVINFTIAFIFALYLLFSKEHLAHQFELIVRAYIKPVVVNRMIEVMSVTDKTFSSFIVGQCTEAVILGTLCALGMWVLQFPYAPMIGAFIGFTALIPVVGAYLGAFVGAFMILTVDPMKAVFFIIFIMLLQQIEGNLIYPRVVGSSIGLPGMWVLAAVTIGGGLSGIFGMLLGVPIAATVYKLLRSDVYQRNGIESGEGRDGDVISEDITGSENAPKENSF